MSRINIGIAPSDLTDKHLLAEHREIKRICYLFNKHKKLIKTMNYKIPNDFRLGEGHLKFFLDKGAYTYYRYLEIHKECKKRGFKVKDYSRNWFEAYSKYSEYFNNYKPSSDDISIIKDRIKRRLANIASLKYYQVQISTKEALLLIG